MNNQEYSTDNASLIAKLFSTVSLLLVFSFISFGFLASGLYDIYQGIQVEGVTHNPKTLANEISKALVLPLRYLFFAFPGWISAMGVLLFSDNRSRPFFLFWSYSTIVLVINIPFGTVLGIILGVTLFIKRKRFNKVQHA